MGKDNEKRDIKKIGIDLAKSSFQVYAANALGKKVMNRKMTKQKLKAFMLNLPPCEVGRVFHRPHPSPNTDKGAIANIREWLRENEIFP